MGTRLVKNQIRDVKHSVRNFPGLANALADQKNRTV
jgi:hypothetical protein